MSARWWFLPGVACLIWILQWVRNTLKPFADIVLSFDGDVALHILLGDLMRERGGWLDTEPTNFLMEGRPFIAHEWLSELLLSYSHSALGLSGPIALTALVLCTLSVLLFRRALELGAGVWPAILVLVSAFTVQNTHLHPRPHVVTWLLAFVFVVWADRFRTGHLDARGWLLRSVPLVILWAQLHAGFLVIAPVLLAFVAGDVVQALSGDSGGWRRAGTYTVGGMMLLLASGLNPWGFALHAHFLAWLGNDYMTSFTTEFQSPDFRGLAGYFLLGFLTLTWLGMAASRERTEPTWFFLVLGMMAMSLHSARHGALFVTLTMPWVALRLQQAISAGAEGTSPLARFLQELQASSQRLGEAEAERAGWGLAALAVVATLATPAAIGAAPITFHPDLQPVTAADWIEAHPDQVQGRMFNPFRWGAYLAWRLYPEHQVYMNSWHDHLGEDALRTYFRVHDVDDDWEAVLKRAGVQWVVYETRSRLAQALDADDTWERVYQDPTASIWRRARRNQGAPDAPAAP